MIVQQLINDIEKLQIQFRSTFEKYKNPLLGVITSRWYFSDSLRLFQNIDLTWENCEVDLISDMVNKIQDFDISATKDSTFELSVCSWYQPYHYTPRTKWGVHIRYRCWGTLSARFNKECPNLIGNPLDSVKAAFFYLYLHELFHHLIENVVSNVEIKRGDPMLYHNYLSYTFNEDFADKYLEESLANSYLFDRSTLCHIDKEYLKQELQSQDEGYNGFINYIESKFNDGLQKLILNIVKENVVLPSNSTIKNDLRISEFFNRSYMQSIPIWIHKMPLRTHAD